MSEMVELVARHLAAKHYADRFGRPADDPYVMLNANACWSNFAGTARAAIDAMREHTEAMLDAGTAALWDACFGSDPGWLPGSKANEVWQEMIDAALTESPNNA
jgi:hypothetical protein